MHLNTSFCPRRWYWGTLLAGTWVQILTTSAVGLGRCCSTWTLIRSTWTYWLTSSTTWVQHIMFMFWQQSTYPYMIRSCYKCVKWLCFHALPDKSPQFVEVEGAVLVFLPGLAHIQQLHDLLSSDKRFRDKNRWHTKKHVMYCNATAILYTANSPAPSFENSTLNLTLPQC